ILKNYRNALKFFNTIYFEDSDHPPDAQFFPQRSYFDDLVEPVLATFISLIIFDWPWAISLITGL
ncbi:16638_t:CDS:2, partial [Funneliformis caledonium]